MGQPVPQALRVDQEHRRGLESGLTASPAGYLRSSLYEVTAHGPACHARDARRSPPRLAAAPPPRRRDVPERRVPRLDQAGRRDDHRREDRRRPDVRHLRQEHLDLRHLRPRVAEGARRDDATSPGRTRRSRPTARCSRSQATSTRSACPSAWPRWRPTGCVQFFDVRDPANIKQVGTIPIANHTAECALDCQYFYGAPGTIIDARGILDGTAPKVIGNWIEELGTQGVDAAELPPHPRDPPGGPAHRLPAVRRDLDQRRGRRLARRSRRCSTRARPRSSSTPRAGRARGPTSSCSPAARRTSRAAASSTTASSRSTAPAGAGRHVEEVRGPDRAGPAGRQRHLRRRQAGRRRARLLGPLVPGARDVPRRRPGRALRVRGRRALPADRPDGSITEQGYFLSLGSSSSSPKWAGKDDVLYSIDYQRGIDILRWTGEHYVRGGRTTAACAGTRGGHRPERRPPPGPETRPARREAADPRLVAGDLQPGGAARLIALGGARAAATPSDAKSGPAQCGPW